MKLQIAILMRVIVGHCIVFKRWKLSKKQFISPVALIVKKIAKPLKDHFLVKGVHFTAYISSTILYQQGFYIFRKP
jgi:hypothetical protein